MIIRLSALYAALGLLAGAAAAETVTYLHTDQLGSPVLETNSAAANVRAADYRAYGDELLSGPQTGPAFIGHYRDADTGLVYMQQRYYDPLVGRFLSVDPKITDAKNGRRFNRYAYADNTPYLFIDPDGRAVSCANGVCTMTADSFDPSRSNGKTAVASPDLRAAGDSAVAKFSVKSGSQESLGFFVPDANGKPQAVKAQDVKTSDKATGDTAAASVPKGAVAAIHGHIDSGPQKSNGLVDAPKLNGGYGDTQSLTGGMPMATVSQGKVGWHEINNGQLQFTYPEGALSGSQEKSMQKNLDAEQTLFHKK